MLLLRRGATGALLLMLLVLTACSGIRPYPARPENNAKVSAEVSGGMLTRIGAALDIYDVDRACQLDYVGSVDLDKAPRTIGLPVGELRYLVVRFERSSFLAGSSGSISYETLFVPKKGENYTLAASYRNSIYNVLIRNAAGREIESRPLADCRPR